MEIKPVGEIGIDKLHADPTHVVSNKMAESMPFAKPPEPLEILMGNPAHSWGKWKRKFEIYLKAIGVSKKPDEMKVGLLLNHIGEPCLEMA